MSRHVLLTGFEPFGPHHVNPSEMVARSFEGRVIAGRVVAVRVLPVDTRSLRERLETALGEEQPEFVIGLGLADGIPAIQIERAALNVLDFQIPDALGTVRKNDPIERGGPDARLATLPLPEILAAFTAVGIPGYLSGDAGTYLCNQWLYEMLALTASGSPPVPAGFLHLPALPAQAVELGAKTTPSMTLELQKRAVETAIEATAAWFDAKPAPAPNRAASSVWIPRGLREVER